jgi:Lrp/AsnC family transcriptional regulator for asnA, asnC and gidA
MDEKDKKIIKLLHEEGRIKIQEIAKKLNISHAAVHARILKLRKEGYIKGFTVVLNPEKFGKKLIYLVYIRVNQKLSDPELAHNELIKIEGVEEIFTTTGEWDFLVKIRTDNLNTLTNFLMKKIQNAVPGFIRNKTCFVIKESLGEFSI